jgi:hypothetical protein
MKLGSKEVELSFESCESSGKLPPGEKRAKLQKTTQQSKKPRITASILTDSYLKKSKGIICLSVDVETGCWIHGWHRPAVDSRF